MRPCFARIAVVHALLLASLSWGLATPAAAQDLSPELLAIWNDPAFQREFTQSYIAATDIEPKITEDERKRMLKVLELISGNKMDEAVTLIQKNLNDAASAVFDFTLANIHFQREQYDQAAAAYEVAVKKYPQFRRAWRNLALIYVRQNKHEQAVAAITRVVELGGGDAVLFGLLGFSYSTLENHLSAESAYRMAMLLDAKTADWKMGLLRTFFKQERFAEASAICKQMIAQTPDRADLWLLQANAFLGMNQPARAAENYEIVDRMGKSTLESLNILADIYVNSELYELAVNTYLRAIDKDPQGSPDRAIRAAKVLTSRGELEQANRLVQRVGEVYADRLETNTRKDLLKLRARLAVATGQSDEEASVLEEIVELDPLDGEALILLGQRAARSNDAAKAIFYYERAAKIEAHEADAKVRHAQLLVSQGQYASALPLLRSAQQLRPRDNVQTYLDQVERISKNR